MNSGPFYVYVHKRPTGEIFYVGKGKGDRAWRKSHRSEYWHRIVAKRGYVVELAFKELSESEAFRFERSLIGFIGRDSLCNHTDGGDGPAGYRHSDEARKRMAELRRGKKHDAETRAKISRANKGKPSVHAGRALSAEHIAKAVRRGRANGRYNPTRHWFSHPSHGSFELTQREFVERFSMHHGAVWGMIAGRVRSAKGWTVGRSAD